MVIHLSMILEFNIQSLSRIAKKGDSQLPSMALMPAVLYRSQ